MNNKFRKGFLFSLVTIYKETLDEGLATTIRQFSVKDWMIFNQKDVPNIFKDLPNYKETLMLKNSPLGKVMMEEDDDNGTEPDTEEET